MKNFIIEIIFKIIIRIYSISFVVLSAQEMAIMVIPTASIVFTVFISAAKIDGSLCTCVTD